MTDLKFRIIKGFIRSACIFGSVSFGACASEFQIEFYSGIDCDANSKTVLSSSEYESETGKSKVCIQGGLYLKKSNIVSIEKIESSGQDIYSEVQKEFEGMNLMDIPGVVSVEGIVEPEFRIVLDEEGAGRLEKMLATSNTLHIVKNNYVISTIYSASSTRGNTLLIFGDALSESARDILENAIKN